MLAPAYEKHYGLCRYDFVRGNMKPSVYIETTIPSYLASRLSSNIITAGQQILTRDWW
jgi:hypothetical protein